MKKNSTLSKKVKSLIGPVLILLIIVAVACVVLLVKDKEEPVEIIKVNAYEGSEEDIILENDKLKLVMDATTTQFNLTVKDTGAVWLSNPEDAANDSLAQASEKNRLRSTLLLTYSTINGVDTLYDNYAFSMERKIFQIEKGDDYIKIFYSIGDIQKEYYAPPVCVEADFEALLSKMSKSDASMVKEYYKKYDINKLGKKDDKEQLLVDYPIMETEVIFVLRNATKDNIKKKFEQLFTEAGYTDQDYARDKELDFSEKSSDKPVFNLSMIFRLDGDDLVVEVPLDEIEYKDDYPLLYLSILPYFGAGTMDESGYLFVPEGGGSIINFNNGKLSQSSYFANMYGWDMATDRSAIVHETRAIFNAFGISKNNNSFICILEDGAPYAGIQADISGKTNSYNYVNALHSISHREQYQLGDKYTGEMFVYEDSLPKEKIVNRYCFVNSDSYVDMAKTYQNYLLNKYSGYMTMSEDTEAPVAVEVLGAIDKIKQIVGIPVSSPLPLTTYKEAADMIKELNEQGFHNMSVKMVGWANGGVKQKILNKVKTISELGNKKSFNNVISTAASLDVPVYLNGITNYAYDSSLLNGFVVFTDSARFVSREKAEIFQYNTVSYGKRDSMETHYLLKANLILKMANNLTTYAQKNATNVSFEDIGYELSSDFNRNGRVTRQEAMLSQQEELKKISDAGTGIIINGGNDYAIPYSDLITRMDLVGSQYTIIDQTVPFYQLAIHGYVDYTGEPLNMTQNWEEEVLNSAQYGAGLAFIFMDEDSFTFQKTLYTQYFATEYAAWKDRAVEIYNRYNQELGHVFNQEMTDHKQLTDKVSLTTYQDGSKVYVNYSFEDYKTSDGVTVPARDYKVLQ
ncbi:MAG TPA: DUF5696 domain-containing protein [Lachnospiraceae bacterium]|nr:DUF5696 domain-containing protein [Lachnospiraceae bacterium]